MDKYLIKLLKLEFKWENITQLRTRKILKDNCPIMSKVQMPEVKNGHCNGVHEIYNDELVLNFKSCLSNLVIF